MYPFWYFCQWSRAGQFGMRSLGGARKMEGGNAESEASGITRFAEGERSLSRASTWLSPIPGRPARRRNLTIKSGKFAKF